MSEVRNHKIRYNRKRYRELANCYVAVADAVERHADITRAAKKFAGLDVDGGNAASEKDTVSLLKVIARTDSDLVRREEALKYLEDWRSASVTMRDADRSAATATYAAKEADIPDDLTNRNGRRLWQTVSGVKYAVYEIVRDVARGVDVNENEPLLSTLIEALASYHGMTAGDTREQFFERPLRRMEQQQR